MQRSIIMMLGLLFILMVAGITLWAAPETTPKSANTGQFFLPPYGNARDRFGFDAGSRVTDYDVAPLHASWYSNWGANLNPPHPDHLVYAQLIRFHAGSDPHDPSQVRVYPNRATIAQIAAAHPGSLWMMSNEPDSFYQGDPILPTTYAGIYHDTYHYIKGLDPSALIANGGIVQPTPCRLEYLDIVWDTYQETYGEPMPVDVWNIHAFVAREVYNSYGVSTPPGVNPDCAIDYPIRDGDNIDIFRDNLVAFRQWMKDKGEQNKPLIISEYGVLWPEYYGGYPFYDEDGRTFYPARVSHFMTQTFDLFLYETFPDVGCPADGYRLVQTWAWYSLDDDQQYNGHLFRNDSKEISPMGETYAAYTTALSDTLYADLSAQLITAQPDLTSFLTGTGTTEALTFTVALEGHIANLGKLPVTDALARFEILSDQGGTVIFGHDTSYDVPARFDGVVALPPLTATLSAPGRHELRLSLDPEDQIDEPRKWNNVASTTLEVRPDLVPLDLTYRLSGPIVQSGTMTLTVTVGNQGNWPSPVVSGTVYLGMVPGGTLSVLQTFSIPPLKIGAQVSLETNLPWPAPDRDLYRLILELDGADSVAEQNEDNNTLEVMIPSSVRATLLPTATTVLTSVSGSVRLAFPSGMVTTPTEIVYTPLWPAYWVTGGLNWSTTAFSLTMFVDGQPSTLPLPRSFSVIWRYSEADLVGLEEERLRLFVLGENSGWQEASCQPYQRDLSQNWLLAAPCRVGRFVFGSRYELYLPLSMSEGTPQNLHLGPALTAPQGDRPHSPLRLP